MAGGGDTPELVAAACEAGALGFIGAAYLKPEQIVEAARAVRSRTAKPFGINLFAPLPAPAAHDLRAAADRIAPYFAELGLQPPNLPSAPGFSFDEQVAGVLESGASVFSFTFGQLPPSSLTQLRDRGMFIMGTATTVREAVALERAGADAVVTQGSEAGGHRGTFLGDFNSAMIGTMALVPQVVDAVSVPVIASGGIMDGRGIAAALALGASAVQLGTVFLTCHESGVPRAYKDAILSAQEDQTRLTRAFSGRPARGIVNRFMTEVEGQGGPESILPFPLQNALTRPLRTAAAQQGRAEFLSLWAGQGLGLARSESVSDLIARLAEETRSTISRLATPD